MVNHKNVPRCFRI